MSVAAHQVASRPSRKFGDAMGRLTELYKYIAANQTRIVDRSLGTVEATNAHVVCARQAHRTLLERQRTRQHRPLPGQPGRDGQALAATSARHPRTPGPGRPHHPRDDQGIPGETAPDRRPGQPTDGRTRHHRPPGTPRDPGRPQTRDPAIHTLNTVHSRS